MNQNNIEPQSNIGLVCDKHAPKPNKYSGTDPKNFLHKSVKLGFPSPQGIEHMRVLVQKIGTSGTDLEGTLDNDPVYDVGYDCGDYIGFDVSEIEDLLHE